MKRNVIVSALAASFLLPNIFSGCKRASNQPKVTGFEQAQPATPTPQATEPAASPSAAVAAVDARVALPLGDVRVVLETSMGRIVLKLFPDKAPKSVANFLEYVKAGHYDGTIFHRVIPTFMIQGGGFAAAMREKPTRASIPNEADNGLKNERGTVAMARTMNPDSATAQFFINVKDNPFLDFRSKDIRGWGYAVFAKVVQGMDVVDQIKDVPTATQGSYENVPTTPVLIKKASILPASK